MGLLRRGGRSSAISMIVMLALVAAALSYLKGRGPDGGEARVGESAGAPGNETADACEASSEECIFGAVTGQGPEETYLAASETCVNAGYLCADVERNGMLRVMRWPEGTGPLRVRVPLPREDDPARARRLQRAAVRGILAWQRRPFELVVDDRTQPRGAAEIQIRWASTLGGNQLGVTEVDWRKQGDRVEFQVRGLTLSTRNPVNPRVGLEERQVMLTAAHEMGHALGLPHSDNPRDVMYPQNTATSLSAQDYRTLEALYGLPNGAIVRKEE